jgi:Transcription elongation factor
LSGQPYCAHTYPIRTIAVSVAFTKEDSAETAAETMLPEKPIPAGPNLVTATGFAALEKQLAEARAAYEKALAIEDINERRRQAANPFRDLRYLAERLRTAQIVPPPDSTDTVAFGSRVTIEREDGRTQTFTIVGEDEADPKAGTISFASPLARALIGKSVGDVTPVGEAEVAIVGIG